MYFVLFFFLFGSMKTKKKELSMKNNEKIFMIKIYSLGTVGCAPGAKLMTKDIFWMVFKKKKELSIKNNEKIFMIKIYSRGTVGCAPGAKLMTKDIFWMVCRLRVC